MRDCNRPPVKSQLWNEYRVGLNVLMQQDPISIVILRWFSYKERSPLNV